MKRVLAVLLVLLLLAGLGVGIFLVQNPQIFRPKAACTGPGCVVEIGVTPTSVTKNKNEEFDLVITLDTKSQEISSLQFVLKYPSDGKDFESVNMDLEPAIASGGWEKRISTQTTSGTDKQIQFAATYNGSWKSAGLVDFARITLKATQDTTKTLTFDSALSKALSGVNATDILVTPTSNVLIAIGGGGAPPPPPPPPPGGAALSCTLTMSPVSTAITTVSETRSLTAAGAGGTPPPSGYTYSWTKTGTGGTLSAVTGPTVTWTAPASLTTTQSWKVAATVSDGTSTSACEKTLTYTASSTTTYYKCSNGACVQDTSGTGFANDSTCNNTCGSSTPAAKYKCANNACVRDDANGTTTASDCNGACPAGGTGGSSVVTPTITTIKAGQKLSALPSKIEGTAKAYVKLTITLQSETVTATVNADASGKWVWYPQTTLDPGSHTLTVTDSDGSNTSVTFTILGASTGTGTGSATTTTLPQAGAVENTILITVAGLIFIAIGSVLFHNL